MGVFWIAKDTRFLHADNEDSDQADLCFLWLHVSESTFLTLRSYSVNSKSPWLTGMTCFGISHRNVKDVVYGQYHLSVSYTS